MVKVQRSRVYTVLNFNFYLFFLSFLLPLSFLSSHHLKVLPVKPSVLVLVELLLSSDEAFSFVFLFHWWHGFCHDYVFCSFSASFLIYSCLLCCFDCLLRAVYRHACALVVSCCPIMSFLSLASPVMPLPRQKSLRMQLPSLKALQSCSLMPSEQSVLDLHASDQLIVMMQPYCPDSQKMRDMLRAIDFTAENGKVVYVNVHGGGELMSTAFSPSGGVYRSYSEKSYGQMKKSFGSVLPKVFRVSVGGKLDPVLYYTHHGTGLKEIRLI